MANLTLRQVRKAYGQVEILHGIDLDIKSGEFIVFVGPSGCGKSTLLRTIAGLEDISAGTLQIDGETVNDVPPSKRGIAMVFQSYALYPHMTVYDNMAFGMRIARAPKEEIDRRVKSAADILQLTPYLARLPRALSGGQRQRVAIGRAIVRNPKVFLFDEPLSNLDAALRVATRIEIAKLKESMPATTMIYVTHDQVEAMTLADRIVVLKDGYIEQVGSPMELYKNPGNLFVARFIGSPSMNILAAAVSRAGARTEVKLPDGHSVEVPVETPANAQGAKVHFGVRPEDLREVSEGGSFFLEGKVDYVEQLGEVQLVYCDIGRADEPLVVKLPGGARIERGAALRLTASPEDLHLFAEDGSSLRRPRLPVAA
ncbi:MAG: sn-glycerol-3-phosphate ABC transporter ATP-binding protein UgpC [Methylobacterium mesophilicum]|nr:sn-glycerol-3-phosphate ABC transporter ATP-binding protein UgpC [Methylobacterium mesophilicum]